MPLESFLESDKLPPSKIHLLEILNDSPIIHKLKIELAITVESGEPFVKATYRMEEMGLLLQ